MALIQFGGAEVGSSAEFTSVNGTQSFVTSGQRTGDYAFRCNPTTTAAGSASLGKPAATGVPAVYDDAAVWLGFAFKAVTLPASLEERICFIDGVAAKIQVRITSGGILKLYTGGSATLALTGSTALSANTWYYIEVKCAVNGSNTDWDLRINGVSEGTGSFANTENVSAIHLGKNANVNGQTVDFYYDDWYVDNAAFQGSTTALPEVRMLRPNANGDGTGWTGGTGSDDFNEVDEVPPGSDGTEDTTYIEATATQDNTYSSFHQESTATRGVTGTIQAVMGFVRAKTGSISGTSTVNIRMRNNTTNVDATGLELTASYQTLRQLRTVDPNGGGAWTSGGVDSVQIGMNAGTIAQTQRFTVAYAMVFATVAVPVTAEIDAVLDEVTASLNLEQAGGNATVTVDSDIDEVSASLTLEQQFLTTIDSDLDKVTAALNGVMLPTATIVSTIDKVTASLNAVITDVATTVQSTIDEVSASLNVVMQPSVTIDSDIDEVMASLNAEQVYLTTIDTDIDKVTAALEVAMLPTVTIVSTIDEVLASLNVVAGVTAAQIVSTLREVAASLNVVMQPAVTIQSTIDEVFASLTLEQRQLITIASTIDEATASLAAQQIYFATIASTLDETSGGFNVSQIYLATVVAVLAEVRASLNAVIPSSVTIASTIDEVVAALNVAAEVFENIIMLDNGVRSLTASPGSGVHDATVNPSNGVSASGVTLAAGVRSPLDA